MEALKGTYDGQALFEKRLRRLGKIRNIAVGAFYAGALVLAVDSFFEGVFTRQIAGTYVLVAALVHLIVTRRARTLINRAAKDLAKAMHDGTASVITFNSPEEYAAFARERGNITEADRAAGITSWDNDNGGKENV